MRSRCHVQIDADMVSLSCDGGSPSLSGLRTAQVPLLVFRAHLSLQVTCILLPVHLCPYVGCSTMRRALALLAQLYRCSGCANSYRGGLVLLFFPFWAEFVTKKCEISPERIGAVLELFRTSNARPKISYFFVFGQLFGSVFGKIKFRPQVRFRSGYLGSVLH